MNQDVSCYWWAGGIFFAGIIGSLIPFGIQRHCANLTDRLLALTSALAGGVCAAVALYLCQEGSRQLQFFWGVSLAEKLGPCASVCAYCIMFSIDFFGTYLQHSSTLSATVSSTELQMNSCIENEHLADRTDCIYSDPIQESCSKKTFKNNINQLSAPLLSVSSNNSVPKLRHTAQHHHHHRCGTISQGAQSLFADSIGFQKGLRGKLFNQKQINVFPLSNNNVVPSSFYVNTLDRKQLDVVSPDIYVFQSPIVCNSAPPSSISSSHSGHNPTKISSDVLQNSQSHVVEDEVSEKLIQNESYYLAHNRTVSPSRKFVETINCPACCCDSDEELCLDACSEDPIDCRHPMGLHPLQLSKAASTTLAHAFQGRVRSFSGYFRPRKDRHCCGGHSCGEINTTNHLEESYVNERHSESLHDRLITNDLSYMSPKDIVMTLNKQQFKDIKHCNNNTSLVLPTNTNDATGAAHSFCIHSNRSTHIPNEQDMLSIGNIHSLDHSVNNSVRDIIIKDNCCFTENKDESSSIEDPLTVGDQPYRSSYLIRIHKDQTGHWRPSNEKINEEFHSGLTGTCVSLLLFFCFSLHSLIEGVGLGSTTDITTLGFGIAMHKWLAGFAVGMSAKTGGTIFCCLKLCILGASLIEADLTAAKFFLATITFSLMTPIGTLFGSLISSLDTKQTARGFCTSIAGGTFLFIAISELIPKAFKRSQDKVAKLIAVLTGAGLVITSEFLLSSH